MVHLGVSSGRRRREEGERHNPVSGKTPILDTHTDVLPVRERLRQKGVAVGPHEPPERADPEPREELALVPRRRPGLVHLLLQLRHGAPEEMADVSPLSPTERIVEDTADRPSEGAGDGGGGGRRRGEARPDVRALRRVE